MSKEQEWASKQVSLFNEQEVVTALKNKIQKSVDNQFDMFYANFDYPDSLLNPPQEIMDNRKQNSRDARERSLPKADSDKGKIFEFMKAQHNKWKYELAKVTAKEISCCTGIDYHAVQRRMSELVRAELVEVCGKRDGYSLYRIKEEAK